MSRFRVRDYHDRRTLMRVTAYRVTVATVGLGLLGTIGITRPPRTPLAQPPGLGHFTCYPVRVTQGAYQVPKGIMLKDEFSPRPVPVQVKNTPVLLCVPTLKFIHGRNRSPYFNKLHLLCFPVSRTPRKPLVFDKNQFGTAVVRIGRTTMLCLPSTKTIIPG